MPQRKKLPSIPDYTGIAPDYQVVQKSNPLLSLSETPLTLAEFKILDAYLSRINSHDPDKRYVRFGKGELEKLLGIGKISKQDLDKRLNNLFVAVTVCDPDKPKGFSKIGLFEKAEATQDKNGLWQVNLACTPSAMEYIFNIENLGYLKYRLKNIIALTSRYSYLLYLYLEKNRFRKSWEADIGELKKMLDCTAETYSQFKRFNDLVLKKCHQELVSKTSLRYSYEPCRKKGRSYTAIKFVVETQQDMIDEPQDQMSFIEADPEAPESEVNYGGGLCGMIGKAYGAKFKFLPEQVHKIAGYLIDGLPSEDDESRLKYLAELIERMEKRNLSKRITNWFAYLCKMFEKENMSQPDFAIGEVVYEADESELEKIESSSDTNSDSLNSLFVELKNTLEANGYYFTDEQIRTIASELKCISPGESDVINFCEILTDVMSKVDPCAPDMYEQVLKQLEEEKMA